ncbi:virulence factor TspB C-terminal domain-related protein [Paraburkholderia acidipaludis]|uniref:virulence factor TspB C-terminal domain-related protein n=1 Tax=Paraburkholderia acidipaludis TaxID=660537 RepID=UPI000A9259AA
MRLRVFVPMVAVLLFGIVYTAPREHAYAQAAAAAPGMGAALAEVVESTLEAAGYSATDAVVEATLAAISSEAAAAAGTAAVAAGVTVAALPWVAVAAAVGMAAFLGSDSVPLGSGGSQLWQFNSDGTVTVSPSAGASAASGASSTTGSTTGEQFSPLVAGATQWWGDSAGDNNSGGSTPLAAAIAYTVYWTASAVAAGLSESWQVTATSDSQCTSVSGGDMSCPAVMTSNGTQTSHPVTVSPRSYASPFGCDSGIATTAGCQADPYAPPPPTPVTGSASSAAASTPAGDDGDLLSPTILAALANALWQQASEQSGYSGVPYPASSPVTSSQASDVESSLGSSAPTIGSAVTGAGSLTGATGSSPFTVTAPSGTSTGTSTGSSGTTGGGTDGTPDLCQLDPTASACAQLGSPPASGVIPSSSVSVSMSPWSIGPASGTCPSPITVQVFGTSLLFDYSPMCTFAGRVEPVVLAVCALAAALIVVGGFKS